MKIYYKKKDPKCLIQNSCTVIVKKVNSRLKKILNSKSFLIIQDIVIKDNDRNPGL